MRTTPVTRRAVLRAMAATALAVPALSACTSGPDQPTAPDPLVELAAQARADAAAAEAIAKAVPSLAESAGEVAKIRAEHAKVLQKEADRERPPASGAPAPTTPSAPAAPTEPAKAKARLVEALTAAQEKASAVVVTVPRHRAGMVGSVVAACASLVEVL